MSAGVWAWEQPRQRQRIAKFCNPAAHIVRIWHVVKQKETGTAIACSLVLSVRESGSLPHACFLLLSVQTSLFQVLAHALPGFRTLGSGKAGLHDTPNTTLQSQAHVDTKLSWNLISRVRVFRTTIPLNTCRQHCWGSVLAST
jgi:hypothetical protein